MFGLKSLIYSKDRLRYPMKRVDFDPDGERNCANRGILGYERISWDEALAIAYAWITEDLYDRESVRTRTHGFDKWRVYILGETDGIAKTPEWQEQETNVPAMDVRALARLWGTRKTYLSPGGLVGFGGACRCATGVEWARSMACAG